MSRLILVVLSSLCFTVLTYATQSSGVKPARADDRAIIQRRTIVIVRPPAVAKQFPDRKRATVVYPVVSGLSEPVLRRIRSLFDFKNIFDYSLQEYREDAWLSEFDFTVNFNSNYLLDMTFTQWGVAAYPDDQTKHFLINLKNGNVIKAADAFDSARLDELAKLVDAKLQQELRKLEKENTEIDSKDLEAQAMGREAYEVLKFEPQNLEDFSVNARGITFLYDAGFPHAIKAFEPSGRYFFSYLQLKPFIKLDGPLGQFVR